MHPAIRFLYLCIVHGRRLPMNSVSLARRCIAPWQGWSVRSRSAGVPAWLSSRLTRAHSGLGSRATACMVSVQSRGSARLLRLKQQPCERDVSQRSHMASHGVCPWWVDFFATPFRRLMQDPAPIVVPYVHAGMTVLEPGPGMGFFTLELARLVGPSGHVIVVDVQRRMIAGLRRRRGWVVASVTCFAWMVSHATPTRRWRASMHGAFRKQGGRWCVGVSRHEERLSCGATEATVSAVWWPAERQDERHRPAELT